MTKKELYEFFKKTKGKKIRWSKWSFGIYFVPVGIEYNDLIKESWIIGDEYDIHNELKREGIRFRAVNGFNDSVFDEGYWQFIEKNDENDVFKITEKDGTVHEVTFIKNDIYWIRDYIESKNMLIIGDDIIVGTSNISKIERVKNDI